MEEKIRRHFEAGLAARQATLEHCLPQIKASAELLTAALRSGGAVYLFGNGGSAADAQHIECELTGRFLKDRPAMNVRALTANSMALTAIANDYGYEEVFARHLQFARPGDVAVGLSTSGKSANVLKGLREARARGAKTIGLCGQDPGPMADLCDAVVAVRHAHTPLIQELHITVGHVWCQWIEDALHG